MPGRAEPPALEGARELGQTPGPGRSSHGGELQDRCVQPGPAQEGREVGDGSGWAITGQSSIFCLARPRLPSLLLGSWSGEVTAALPRSVPAWSSARVGGCACSHQQGGRLESPKILPATGSTHTSDTHWPGSGQELPNTRTSCPGLQMETQVQAPTSAAVRSWAWVVRLRGWR